MMRAAIAAREAFSIEVLNYAKDGRAYWVAIDCTPVFDHLGRLERFVAMERDITSTRELHAELKASEEKHRRIFETAREVIWEFDHQGRITLLNPAWERLTGHSIADTLGRHFVDFMVDNQRTAGRLALQAINEGGAEEFNELGCFITRAGEERWFEIRARAYRRPGGERFCVGSLHDVHERRMAEESRRAAEEALHESQERYARAIEAASDAIWEHDRGTGRFYVSDRFAEMLRVDTAVHPTSPEEVFSKVHPDDLAAHLRHLDAMVTSSDTVTWESRFRAGDGSYRWLRIRGRAIRDAAGVPVLTSGTASDVHDARLAGEELRAMQVRYQRAMDGSNDGVFERNMLTDEFYFSDRFDEILGYPPGGMPRQRDAWIKMIHPDDRKSHAEAVERLVAGNAAVMWEVRFGTARGEYRWLRLRGIATRDARGVPFLTSGTASDIHQARLAEEELKRHRDNLAHLVEERTAGLEAAGREAERQREEAEAARQIAVDANLAKSEFLANMSHELRTPMHAIISFANFGVEKIDRVDAAKLLHYFHNIRKSGSRLLSLLNDLLDLSKLEAGKMQMSRQPSDLGGLIGEAIAEVEMLARSRDIDLRSKTVGPATASIDNMRMLQVLRNLLSNAIKFTPEGGAVRVECAFVPCGGFDAASGSIEISVSDNGLGIPENELEAVFDKFVQSSKTKTGAGGTGLGLAICREIVTAHGGTIQAFNNPSPASGATFVVRLPAGEPARVALPEQSLT
jgi:PAS domain S-box-containing protein